MAGAPPLYGGAVTVTGTRAPGAGRATARAGRRGGGGTGDPRQALDLATVPDVHGYDLLCVASPTAPTVFTRLPRDARVLASEPHEPR